MNLIDRDNILRDTAGYECVADVLNAIRQAPVICSRNNPPLTLEELRKMDGEPVWNDTMKKWMLVDLLWEFGERAVTHDGRWRNLDDRYYRRKPEEQT